MLILARTEITPSQFRNLLTLAVFTTKNVILLYIFLNEDSAIAVREILSPLRQ